MTDQQSSLLVGVFQNMADAKQAYDELSRAGYGDDYLGFADPLAGNDGLAQELKQAGVPADDSRFYEHEFQSGRPIVTLRAGGSSRGGYSEGQGYLKAIRCLRCNERA